MKPGLIINCAAYTKVDQAEDDSSAAFEVNEKGVHFLAEWCAANQVMLIHYSTDYVFSGNADDRKFYPDGYPEDVVTSPQNVYGKSKLAGEIAIQNSGAPHLIIRVSWLCGKYGNNFVKTMLRLASERDELSVVDDQLGSPTFTEDVVKSTKLLMDMHQKGIFHVTSTGLITWYDFAKAIFELRDVNIKLKKVTSDEFPVKAKRPAFSKLSTVKFTQLTGAEPADWKEQLQKLLQDLD
jgi:dTDP-4-dehydrorhamnose reductase